MAGPLSFIAGLLLVGAGAAQDAAKREEMERYNAEQRELNYMPEHRKFKYEGDFDVINPHAFWTCPGGIDLKKLEKLYKESRGRKMDYLTRTLTLTKHFVEKLTGYNYNSHPNRFYTADGEAFEFDFKDVCHDNWGKRFEFDPDLEVVRVVKRERLGSEEYFREDWQDTVRDRAQWIAWQIQMTFDLEDRDQWCMPYRIFNVYRSKPRWLEGRKECFHRILKEQGIYDDLLDEWPLDEIDFYQFAPYKDFYCEGNLGF